MNRTAASTLARYADEPLGTRLHTRIRWRSCPFEDVAAAVPLDARVLEIGCGHGLLSTFLALGSGRRSVVGTDVDGGKIRAASRAAEGIANLTFAPVAAGEIPDGPWDAICIVDVLYLIDHEAAAALLRDAAERLVAGGVVVVKEMARAPAWKFRGMVLQEQLSVRVLRITEGDGVDFIPPDDLAALLADAGLVDITHRPLHAGRLHPHHLVTARKPGASGGDG